MSASAQFLSPAEAAKRLRVSAKALRLYEQRGLLAPARTKAGYRAYGPEQMARAAEIAALRALGLSLGQVKAALSSGAWCLDPTLVAHQAVLEGRFRYLAETIEKVRTVRAALAKNQSPSIAGAIAHLPEPAVALELPWPWGGERFELPEIRRLSFITGPLGSGKTRLARRLAETLPGAAYLGPERLADSGARAQARLDADPALRSRVDRIRAQLVEDGAAESDALIALLAGLAAGGAAALVIDMPEQGLDEITQRALMAHLRRRGPEVQPLFLLTRSSAILDLDLMGADEAIIFCPANHSPPIRVAPSCHATGYESLTMCLASHKVRARTEGVVAAWRKVE